MANGNDQAFDAMNAVNAVDDIDLTGGGEVSAWFPTGKFLGMNVPKGTSGIIEGLVFLAAGSPGPKVASALKSKIKADVAVKHFPPAMQEKIIGTAAEQMDYFKKVRTIASNMTGKPGIQEAKKVFDAAIKNAPPGIAKDEALKQISGNKAVRDFAKRHGERLAEWDIPSSSMLGPKWHKASKQISGEYKKRIEPLTEAAFEKVGTTNKLRIFLDDFKQAQYKQAVRAGATRSNVEQGLIAGGKFSIPSLLDELAE